MLRALLWALISKDFLPSGVFSLVQSETDRAATVTPDGLMAYNALAGMWAQHHAAP